MCEYLYQGGARCSTHAVTRWLDALNQYGYEFPGGPPVDPLSAVSRLEIAAPTSEIISERDSLIAEGDPEKLQQWVAARTADGSFSAMLSEQQRLRNMLPQLEMAHTKLWEEQDALPAEECDYTAARHAGFALLEARERIGAMKADLEAYKDVTAPAAAALGEAVQREGLPGAVAVYPESLLTLGDAHHAGEFEVGSREWLVARQSGFGGSDAGALVGSEPRYAAAARKEILDSKVSPISDEVVAAQALQKVTFAGAAGRGDAWELAITQEFQRRNPELRVEHTKATWRSSVNEFQQVNLDALWRDAEGNVEGVLEDKTASDASAWGAESEGLDGVPANYRAQLLYNMDAIGVSKGAIAVVINDREFRQYHVILDDELRAEVAGIKRTTAEAWDQVCQMRADGVSEVAVSQSAKGFPEGALNSGVAGEKMRIYKEVADWRGTTPEEVKARYMKLLPDSKLRKSKANVEAALRRLYQESAINRSDLVSIDLETNDFAPTRGRIIDFGAVSPGANGGVRVVHDELFCPPETSLRHVGAGATEVHNIRVEDLLGKASFYEPEKQERILKALTGKVVLAHNASFEDRFLRQHLAGYAEARRRGEIRMVCTKQVASRFTGTETNSLKAFVEENGDQYVNAHRAAPDAAMALKAFEKFSSSFFLQPQSRRQAFVPPESLDDIAAKQ